MVFAFEMVDVGNRKFLNTQRGMFRPNVAGASQSARRFSRSFEMVRIAVAFRNKTLLRF